MSKEMKKFTVTIATMLIVILIFHGVTSDWSNWLFGSAIVLVAFSVCYAAVAWVRKKS